MGCKERVRACRRAQAIHYHRLQCGVAGGRGGVAHGSQLEIMEREQERASAGGSLMPAAYTSTHAEQPRRTWHGQRGTGQKAKEWAQASNAIDDSHCEAAVRHSGRRLRRHRHSHGGRQPGEQAAAKRACNLRTRLHQPPP